MRRDGDYIRDGSGAIVVEGWPCMPSRKRRQAMNVMAAAPVLVAALKHAQQLAQRRGAPAAEMAPILHALRAAHPHPATLLGRCDVCGHYGADCTGKRWRLPSC